MSYLGRGLVDPGLVNPQVAHLPPPPESRSLEALAARHGLPVEAFACLDANENPLGASERALEAVRGSLAEAHRYPDAAASRLRSALAERHGVPEARVFLGSGSTQVIELLVRTFVGPGQTVLGGWPSFAAYRAAAEVAGREFLAAPLRQGRLDLAALSALADPRTKLVFIANPNNPTGTHVSLRELAAFLNRMPPEALVVVDEAYADFVEAEDYPDAIRELLPGHPRLVVLRTFSKSHGLAGLRIGYGVMAPALVRSLELVQPLHSVNLAALVGAEAALADGEHVERGRRMVLRERVKVRERLAKMGLTVIPSQGNFHWVGGLPRDMARRLERRGVLVRCMSGYGAEDAIRAAVGPPEANARLFEALTAELIEASA